MVGVHGWRVDAINFDGGRYSLWSIFVSILENCLCL
jgi:hypothetical protein